MKPSLKGKRHIFISEASAHIGVEPLDLYDWLSIHKVSLYAFSEFSGDIRPIERSFSNLLLNRLRPLKKVRFIYPKSFVKRWRLGSNSPDLQELHREDLKLSVKDVIKFGDEIRSTYGETKSGKSSKRGSRNKKGKVDDRGSHHLTKRKIITEQAKKLLINSPEKFLKKNKNLNQSKIVEHLDNTKDIWLKDRLSWYGFGEDTIKKVVRQVVQSWSDKK